MRMPSYPIFFRSSFYCRCCYCYYVYNFMWIYALMKCLSASLEHWNNKIEIKIWELEMEKKKTEIKRQKICNFSSKCPAITSTVIFLIHKEECFNNGQRLDGGVNEVEYCRNSKQKNDVSNNFVRVFSFWWGIGEHLPITGLLKSQFLYGNFWNCFID